MLSIDNTFGRARPPAERRTTWSPARAPLAFTFGLGMLVVFPLRAGACALLTEAATPAQLADIVAEHGVTVLATAPDRVQGRSCAPARSSQLAGLRAAVSAGEHIPRGRPGSGSATSSACRSSTASAPPSCCTSSSPRPATTSGRARPASRCPATGPRSSAPTAPSSARASRGGSRVIGPVGCRYLDDERQRELRRSSGWNVTGDTFYRDDGRLLLLPGPHRQHDRVLGLQHRRPRGRGGHRHAPRRRSSPRWSAGRTPSAARSSARSWCCEPGVLGDAAKAREIQDHVKQHARAVQVPARRPLHATRCRATPAASCSTSRCAQARGRGAEQEQAPTPKETSMKIAIVGGGPGGLYFAALMKQLDPRHEVTVWERNAAGRHVRLRRGVLRRDARRHRERRHRSSTADGAAVRPLDRHRHPLTGASASRSAARASRR